MNTAYSTPSPPATHQIENYYRQIITVEWGVVAHRRCPGSKPNILSKLHFVYKGIIGISIKLRMCDIHKGIFQESQMPPMYSRRL